MSFYGSSEEHQPVTWVRGHPVYGAHLIAAVFIASMIAAGLVMFFNRTDLLLLGVFTSSAVRQGEVWRIFTYGLINAPAAVDAVIWFAIEMLMLVWFGREVEKFFGRAKFFFLYAGVYLLPPIVAALLGRWIPSRLVGESGAFAIFVAFAVLYPNVGVFFALIAKWVAAILFGIYTIVALAQHDWGMIISAWSSSAFALAFVRYQQGLITMPRMRLPRRKPKLRVLPDLPRESKSGASSMAEIDALLDKIAQSGIGSLSAKERAKLDAARADLKRRSSQ